MILPPHMAFTACPIRIDIEGSSCLIICHVNVISSLAPELLFRMVKALIHFIISFYLLISRWSFIFVYAIVFIYIKLSKTMTCACVLRRIYWDFLSEWIYISVNVPQILPGGICNIFSPHVTQVQFIIKIWQIYQNLFYINLTVSNVTASSSPKQPPSLSVHRTVLPLLLGFSLLFLSPLSTCEPLR